MVSPDYICYMNWQKHIISDKDILLGKPCIKGTRISVELVLELLASGWTESQLLESYPVLTTDDIKAIFGYLKDCLEQEFYFPLPKSA
jgi:uncharacterized protein (DUF433 family)